MAHTRAESPPQAENFADFGPLNQRFTMGKRSQKGSKKSISRPLLSPPLLSQISQKEGGTEEVICPDIKFYKGKYFLLKNFHFLKIFDLDFFLPKKKRDFFLELNKKLGHSFDVKN